jgi:hypothetical protein
MGSQNDCHVWDVATGQELVAYKQHHDGIVMAAAISPDGRHAATAGGDKNEIHVWDLKTGERVKGSDGQQLKLAGTGASGWAAGFARDGARIAWGSSYRFLSQNERGPFEYQLRLPGGGQGLGRPEKMASAVDNFIRARTTYNAWSLAHRPGGDFGDKDAVLDILKNSKAVASIQRGAAEGYSHRSYSITPNGDSIISGGTNGALVAYGFDGKPRGTFIGHEGEVWAVTPSPDGRLLVSTSADQTVRIWNLSTRELIVTLFNGADGEWVMWTPQGYYTGSPGADKIVGWQVKKGPDQAADFVGAEQLRQHLNRPDIVEKAIILASAEQAVREAEGTTFQLADLLSRPVPRFKIVAPLSGAIERDGRVGISIAIDAIPDPIRAIRVQVNGRQVEEQTPDIGSGGFQPGMRMLDVPLARGRNEVRVTLTNSIGEKAETLTLTHEGDGALDKRGTLYIVAIGVDKYPQLGNRCGEDGRQSCDLNCSGADARALVEAVEKRLAPSHTSIVKRVLVNGVGASTNPTAANILDAIDLFKQAEEIDTVLLFMAGHAFNDGPNYRFLATNAEWIGAALRGSTVVPWQILQEAVEAAKGRRVLLIDTCHASNAYNQRLGNAAYHANIIAYTAARFDQEALEDARLGHGLFTYAAVEGLSREGQLGAKRQISTKELANYVVTRVDQLAKALNGVQEPQYFRGRDAEDYVLARW